LLRRATRNSRGSRACVRSRENLLISFIP